MGVPAGGQGWLGRGAVCGLQANHAPNQGGDPHWGAGLARERGAVILVSSRSGRSAILVAQLLLYRTLTSNNT